MKYFFWDVDGTLVDTKEGVLNAYRYTFDKLGKPTPPDSVLMQGIGPATEYGFEHIMNLDRNTAKTAFEYFCEYYGEKGVLESTPYRGAEEALALVKELGYNNYIASMKKEEHCATLLKARGWDRYIDGLYGENPAKGFTEKTAELACGMAETGADGRDAVIIGDKASDIAAGKKTGIWTAAALYGYGGREELVPAKADVYIETGEDLAQFIKRFAEGMV